MADYQRVVEFLRDFRASPAPQVTEEVRQYASEYADLCNKANERLRQCSTFLQQGLRSEAIHLSEETPNLLDMVAALDLPDAQAWIEFCQQYDLPVSPLIQIERATQLNDAYSQDEPLQVMLRRLRRMALARSPIRDRLVAMRQVASMDAGSAFWEKDIRVFEQIRLRELRHLFSLALRGRENRAIAALADEVLQSPWLERVPDDLQQAATNARQQIAVMEAEARLQTVLSKLHDAYAARSVKECATLLEQCKAICASVERLQVPAHAAAEIKQVMAWVNEENETAARHRAFAEAGHALAGLLTADAPDAQLDDAYAKLKSFEMPLPRDLEERYHRTIRSRASASRRKYWLAIVSVAAVVAVALAGFYWYSQTNASSSWARKIKDANDAKNLTLARQLIEDQEKRVPQFNAIPEVAAAKKTTADLEERFKQETKTVQIMIAQLAAQEKQLRDLVNAEQPRPEDLLAAAASLDAIVKPYLSPSLDIAWVDPKKQLSQAVDRIKLFETPLRTKALNIVHGRIDTLAQDVDKAVSQQAPADPTALQTQFDDLLRQIDALGRVEPIDEAGRNSLAALAQRIETKRQSMAASSDQVNAYRALRRQVTSASAIVVALHGYGTRFPESPATAEFKKAVANSSAAHSIEVWRDLIPAWSDRPAPVSEAVAQQRIGVLETYLTDHPNSPYAPAARTYVQYLKQAAAALAVSNTWQNGFKELLSTPLLTELRYLATSDGKKYYVLADPKIVKRRMNDTIIVQFKALDPANLTKTKDIRVDPPLKLLDENPALVPHASFVEKMIAQIKTVDASNWDSIGIDLIDQLVKERDIDPVVRAILLKETLQINQQVIGWAIGSMYEPALQGLLRQTPGNIIWYDPDRPVAPATLQSLKSTIDKLPRSDVARAELEKTKVQMFKGVTTSFVGTGVLLQDDSGATAVFSDAAPADGYVVIAPGPTPMPTAAPTTGPSTPATPLIRVAVAKGGKYVLEDAAATLPQGTIVFVVK